MERNTEPRSTASRNDSESITIPFGLVDWLSPHTTSLVSRFADAYLRAARFGLKQRQPIYVSFDVTDRDAVPEEIEDAPTTPYERTPKPTEKPRRVGTRRSPRIFRRATTIPQKRMTRVDAREANTDLSAELDELDALRPKTRGDCVNGQRPCLWIGCRYSLFIDVDPETGSLKFNRPELEPHEMPQSCALDVADEGPHSLEQVGDCTNLTRERIRQIEMISLHKLKGTAMVLEIGLGSFTDRDEVIL